MNIIVLVKQVPDTTEIKIDKVTNTLIRTGVKNIINPDDLAGVEVALSLKEAYGGSVTTVTMGPPHAENMITTLYARGIDNAYLLTDRKFAGSDTWATSKILSTFIKTLDYDLIIAGYQAIDGDTAQVGPQIAEFLNIDQVTHIHKINEVKKDTIFLEKSFEDETHVISAKFPLLISTIRSMNQPRLMNAFDIWDSFDKKINIVTFEDLDLDQKDIGLTGSPTRVKKTYTKPVMQKSPKEVLEPEEAAKKIARLIYPYMEVAK
ncbi:MAG: electron transfer flavoprotein subunit beta/FixA family protein [Acholeplasmataceae bacterium]|nr:electron transfer flavoprotein subunit beta/FixA family protein [Acholeplasmataceae bacterium]